MIKRGAGILLLHRCSRSALLLRRSALVDKPGLWSIPGGGADAGDGGPWETARREFEEETGLPTPERYAGVYRDTVYDTAGKPSSEFLTFVVYLGACKLPPKARLNAENDASRWVTYDQARMLRLYPRFAHLLQRIGW